MHLKIRQIIFPTAVTSFYSELLLKSVLMADQILKKYENFLFQHSLKTCTYKTFNFIHIFMTIVDFYKYQLQFSFSSFDCLLCLTAQFNRMWSSKEWDIQGDPQGVSSKSVRGSCSLGVESQERRLWLLNSKLNCFLDL